LFIIKINDPLIVKVTFVLNVCHSLFALRNLCKYFIGLYGLIIDLKQKQKKARYILHQALKIN